MSNTSKCPWCLTDLPMDTGADREIARYHVAACARDGNSREVVQAEPVKKPSARPEIK